LHDAMARYGRTILFNVDNAVFLCGIDHCRFTSYWTFGRVMMLRHFQFGRAPSQYVLIGEQRGMIGDPSGKFTERNLIG